MYFFVLQLKKAFTENPCFNPVSKRIQCTIFNLVIHWIHFLTCIERVVFSELFLLLYTEIHTRLPILIKRSSGTYNKELHYPTIEPMHVAQSASHIHCYFNSFSSCLILVFVWCFSAFFDPVHSLFARLIRKREFLQLG